jgi:hypothetical protein
MVRTEVGIAREAVVALIRRGLVAVGPGGDVPCEPGKLRPPRESMSMPVAQMS